MATGFVGEAWVQITPSFTGFQNAVRKEITGAMPAAGRDAGAQLGKALVPSGEKAGKDAGAEAGKGFASKALGAGKDFAESVGRGMLQVTGQVARVGANLGGVATAGLVAFGVSSARAAMRVGELDVSMQAIGKSSGIGYEAMRRTTKEVRSQGIEMAAAQGIAIDFARANLDMADASKLARVAQDAAVIGQTNSTEATERLMHGITTLNPIVLRQLGITVDANEAYAKYGKTIGVAASELTPAQKQQAFLNETLAQGATIAGVYEASMQEPGKLLRSFPRLFNDAAVAVGQEFTPALGAVIKPFYDFTKMVTTSLEEGGKLHPIVKAVGEALTGMLEPLKGVAGRMTEWFKGLSDERVAKFADTIKQFAPLIASAGAAMATFAGKNLAGNIPVVGQFVAKLNPLAGGIVALVLATPELRDAFTQLLGRLTPLIPPLTKLFGRIVDLTMKAVLPLIDPLMKLANTALDAVIDAVNILIPVVDTLLDVLGPIIKIVSEVLVVVLEALQPILKPLAYAIIAVVVAFTALNVVMWALSLNPIVLIIMAIVAAVVALIYGVIQLVRNWETVWGAITAAARWAYDTVLKPVFDAIKTAWNAVVTAFKWAWDTIMKPVIDVMSVVFRVLYAFTILPIVLLIQAAWDLLAKAFRWAWDSIMKPVVDAIAAAFNWVWGNVLKPVFDAFRTVFDALAAAFRWAWENVIRPAWNAFHSAVNWAWNNVIRPVYDAMGAAWRGVGNGIKWVWENVIEPAWNLFKKGIEGVRSVFEGAVSAIKSAWDSIKNAIKTPVKWVVDYVINPLIRGANFLLEKVGLKVDEIKMAQGGRVPGGWGGGDRVHALLEPGEWVLTKRQARSIGYDRLRGLPRYAEGGYVEGPGARGLIPDWLGNAFETVTGGFGSLMKMGKDILNSATGLIRWAAAEAFELGLKPLKALIETVMGREPPWWRAVGGTGTWFLDKIVELVRGKTDEPDWAGGGMAIDDVVKQVLSVFPNLRVTSAHRPGDPGYHGRNLARDLGGPVGVMRDAGSWIQSTLTAALAEGIYNPTLSVKNGKVVAPAFWGPGTWANHADHIHVASEGVGAGMAGPGGAVERWRPVVEKAFALWGMPVRGEWVNMVLQVVKHESGGNPNAVNNWDSNAQKGVPSGGLIQIIQPTYNANKHPSSGGNRLEPLANLAAGIRYMWSRYGGVWNLPGIKNILRGGGWVGYDSGGWLPPGASLVVNQTGRPEPILTSKQWDELSASARAGNNSDMVELLRRIADRLASGTNVEIDGDVVARTVNSRTLFGVPA